VTDVDALLEDQLAGARAGALPMFGEWTRQFDFRPVSVTAKRERKDEFISRVRASIWEKFLFSRDVQVDIEIYGFEQENMEDSQAADIDNFSKVIMDAIKGPKGILIDDIQVQSILICRDDYFPKDLGFKIRIRSDPAAYVSKNVLFYEMPDNLYYPLSLSRWDSGEFVDISSDDKYLSLKLSESTAMFRKSARRRLRELKFNKKSAGLEASKFHCSERGFPRGRLAEGFLALDFQGWQNDFDELRKKVNPELQSLAEDTSRLFEERMKILDRYKRGRV
jgi:Holliday junction resolvase RusA-like endonuclease